MIKYAKHTVYFVIPLSIPVGSLPEEHQWLHPRDEGQWENSENPNPVEYGEIALPLCLSMFWSSEREFDLQDKEYY
jgi:hypothetical protein